MDDTPCLWALGGICLDFSHEIVVYYVLYFRGLLYIDVVFVGFKFFNLFLAYNTSFLLSSGKGDPDSSKKFPFMDL